MTASLMQAARSLLVLVDYQSKLIPAIHDAPAVLANANRLLAAADLLGVPVVVTEQSAQSIGHTVADIDVSKRKVIAKATFGSCGTPEFVDAIGSYPDIILAGCEAHVCVTQTVLGLLELGRRVFVVVDATGARQSLSKETALARMARNGAEIVTSEMVVFEWLQTAQHEKIRAAIELVK